MSIHQKIIQRYHSFIEENHKDPNVIYLGPGEYRELLEEFKHKFKIIHGTKADAGQFKEYMGCKKKGDSIKFAVEHILVDKLVYWKLIKGPTPNLN